MNAVTKSNRRLQHIYLTRADAKRVADKPHRYDRAMVEAAQTALVDAPEGDEQAAAALRALHQYLVRQWTDRDESRTYRWDRADDQFSVTWSSVDQIADGSFRAIFIAMRDLGLSHCVDAAGNKYWVI